MVYWPALPGQRSSNSTEIKIGSNISDKPGIAYVLFGIKYNNISKENISWGQFWGFDPNLRGFVRGGCGPIEWFTVPAQEREETQYFLFEVPYGTYAYAPGTGGQQIKVMDWSETVYFYLSSGHINYIGDFEKDREYHVVMRKNLISAKEFIKKFDVWPGSGIIEPQLTTIMAVPPYAATCY